MSNPLTVRLECEYLIPKEVQKKEVLAGHRTPRLRKVSVTLDAAEAIRTGYAAISQDGDITMRLQPSQMLRKLDGVLSQQDPNLLFSSSWDPPEFDHILEESEALGLILGEMKRFDEVLAEAKGKKEESLQAKDEDVHASTVFTNIKEYPLFKAHVNRMAQSLIKCPICQNSTWRIGEAKFKIGDHDSDRSVMVMNCTDCFFCHLFHQSPTK